MCSHGSFGSIMNYGGSFYRQNRVQERGNVLTWLEGVSQNRQTTGMNINAKGRLGFPKVCF